MFLFVGHCCVDDVYHVIKYPAEDSAVGSRTSPNRCTKQSWERGGNASNNASVLAGLGADVEFLGTLANDQLLDFFRNDMKSYGIKCDNCPVVSTGKSPTSVVICSEETGSRTIVHSNGNLPELTFENFKESVDLSQYSWIHFEGRNEAQLPEMLTYIQEYNAAHATDQSSSGSQSEFNYTKKKLPISIEVEKQRESLSILLSFADVVFIGKEFAVMNGARDCRHAAEIFSASLPKGILIICPWGEHGAAFCMAGKPKDQIKQIQAYPPNKIVDSLGAGDTFDASIIYGLVNNLDPETSVRLGCKAAGAKLGIYGFRNILAAVQDFPEFQITQKK